MSRGVCGGWGVGGSRRCIECSFRAVSVGLNDRNRNNPQRDESRADWGRFLLAISPGDNSKKITGPFIDQSLIASRSVPEQFQSHFRAISEPFQSHFRAVSEQFQSSFRAVSEQFQSNFRAISEQFQSISRAISERTRALGTSIGRRPNY